LGKLDYLLLIFRQALGHSLRFRESQLTGAYRRHPRKWPYRMSKAVSMCHKVNIPILGIVENESYFVCDACEKRHDIFGRGGERRLQK
jgi:hypothetical protein